MTFLPPYLGAAYYPEDWPESELEKDVVRMKDAGINCIRIAEFAWSRIEPEPGNYQFGWIHRIIDTMGAAGIATVLCTPTATPPAWFYFAHPEIAKEDINGNKRNHGGRRHCCSNYKVYWDAAMAVVTQVAKEFGNEPNVIGWQIDNEIYPIDEFICYCPECHKGFQKYLQDRYGDIKSLNAAWNLTVFSQEFQSFEQIPLPRFVWKNPHLYQAWLQYQAEVTIDFVDAQAQILRQFVHVPIGTDLMPLNGINYCKMFRNMDIVQYNHYNTVDNIWHSAMWFDKMRTIADRPFWNTETAVNWNGNCVIDQSLKPTGFCNANSWMSLALGAEANMYWLWRTHWGAQELMHGAVLSSSARPMVGYREVQKLSQDFHEAADFINGTKVQTAVAMLFPSLAWIMFETQPIHRELKYLNVLRDNFYKAFLGECCRLDILEAEQDISKYKVIFAPLVPSLQDANIGERLKQWVKNGGILVAGPLTDVRNNDGTRYQYSEYGMLEEFAGVRWCYEVPIAKGSVNCVWKDGAAFDAEVWMELCEPDADALATVKSAINDEVVGKTVLSRKTIGNGAVYMLGTIPSKETMQRLVSLVLDEAGLAHGNGDGDAILVSPRSGKSGEGVILLEYANHGGSYTLPQPGIDILTGETLVGNVQLAPYQVRVIEYC